MAGDAAAALEDPSRGRRRGHLQSQGAATTQAGQQQSERRGERRGRRRTSDGRGDAALLMALGSTDSGNTSDGTATDGTATTVSEDEGLAEDSMAPASALTQLARGH